MPKKYSYNDFWEMRGRRSIWFTKNISYRMGALIALIASRVGVSPNTVSLMSGLITVLSSVWAFYIGSDDWVALVILLVGLQLGYAFDCADGPLARVTNRQSRFGILMDKLVDLSSGMIFPCVLAFGAGSFYWDKHLMTFGVIIPILTLRVVYSVMIWMKELILHKADRLKEDARNHTLWWKVKKVVSLYIDEPVYRFGVAISWSCSFFWEFFIVYHIGVLVIAFIHFFSSKKEMDWIDRQRPGNFAT